jgi:hypothetical protein
MSDRGFGPFFRNLGPPLLNLSKISRDIIKSPSEDECKIVWCEGLFGDELKLKSSVAIYDMLWSLVGVWPLALFQAPRRF